VAAALGLSNKLGGGGATTAVNPTVSPQVAPPPTPAPTVEPPVAPPPQPAPTPAAPAHATITITSSPTGAEVLRGRENVGRTPATVSLAVGSAPIELVLRKHGYKDREVQVTPDKDRAYDVDLVAVGKPGGHRAPVAKPAPAPPAPAPTAPPHPTAKPAGKLRDLKDPFAN
jgi:hypothetical protein